jgi:hypothetical protein
MTKTVRPLIPLSHLHFHLVLRVADRVNEWIALEGLSAPQRWENIQPYTTPAQLSTELLTLSLMPRSRWQTLLNLETIKVRFSSLLPSSLLPSFPKRS